MVQAFGFYWPSAPEERIIIDSGHIPQYLEHIPVRGVVVQAGGNVGVYPKALSEHFDLVYTFEPAKDNYDCLMRNIEGIDNIIPWHGALGSDHRTVGLERDDHNCGMHKIDEASGSIPMYAIDNLPLKRCDLIWLDVERYEKKVLKGAEKTIERWSPAIIVEGKAAAKWLKGHGYNYATKLWRLDTLWTKSPL